MLASIVFWMAGCSGGPEDSVGGDDTAHSTDDSGGDDSGGDDSGDDSGTLPSDDGTDVARVGWLSEVAVAVFDGLDESIRTGAGSIVFLPDVSGDGWPDAMVGAPAEVSGAKHVDWLPRAYVLEGGPHEKGEVLEPLSEIRSEHSFDMGGLVLGSAGDLDGDGWSEVLYTRPQSEPGLLDFFAPPLPAEANASEADVEVEVPSDAGYMWSFASSGDGWWGLTTFTEDRAITLVDGMPTDGSTIDDIAAVRATLEGGAGNLHFDDLDGDGVLDLTVASFEGHVRAFEGPLLDGPLDGVGLTIGGAGDIVSGFTTVGDVDGDGRVDLVLRDYEDGDSNVRVFTNLFPLDHVIALDDALLVVTPEHDGDNFGTSLTTLGDVDGDGLADVAVGTAGPESVPTDRVYALLSPPPSGVIVASELDAAWTSTEGVGDIAGGVDTDADGTLELLVGAPGAAPGGLAGAGRLYWTEGLPK